MQIGEAHLIMCGSHWTLLLMSLCVWQSSRSKQQTMFVPAKLTVVGVFNQLRDIASMSGNAVSLAVVICICAVIEVIGCL